MSEAQFLLEDLKAEREKYTQADTARMQAICDRLVDLGVYPAQSGIGFTPLHMVECYGVDWHVWRGPLECRHCGADLRDHEHGPPFKREIGMYDMGEDRTTHMVCPDCKKVLFFFPR